MYAIIREGNGNYYTSTVFGFFCKVTASDDYQRYLERIHNQFYLVLNQSKTALVTKYIFTAGNRYLDPKVIITDTDTTDWVSLSVLDNTREVVSFFANLTVDAEELLVPETLLQQCIAMDRAYTFQPYRDVTDVKSINDLMEVAGGFHDGQIERLEKQDDCIYLLFRDIWGCKLELWFEGDVLCSTSILEDDSVCPWWMDASILKENNFYYLIDDCCDTISEITASHCWFRGRHLRYHVIPNP